MVYPNIIKLDCDNEDHINAISFLHKELLPESKVSELGAFFLKKFYYNTLVKDKLIDCYLYKFNDKFVGFISCTDMPFDFMRIGVKKNLCRLIFVTAVTLIQNPFRIKTLFKIISEKISGQVKNKLHDNGQFMSFGVLEEYRMIKDGETNLTIPHVMMRKVFEHFREKNINSFFLLVLTSNERAIRFYNKYNCLVLDKHFGESSIIKFETDNAE